MVGKVILEGLEFHAHHGIYPQERSLGNKFEVDVLVSTEFDDSAFDDNISGTIDYEILFEIVKNEMEKESNLLEKVGYSMATKVLEAFQRAKSVEINISKLNPPIGGVCKKATVTITKRRGNSN